MKIIEEQSSLLTNIEVIHALREREADKQAVVSKALPSEIKAHDSLVQYAGTVQSREDLQKFLEAIKDYNLTKAELVQIVNLKPTSLVEIYLCVEQCEDRLSEDRIEELLQLIQGHLI